MLDLSAVVLTKNEAERIQRCLESIRWIPEIIVVDDQSQDETVKICKRYTEKVIVHPLENDFAQQRNIGTLATSHSWILQLDADEVVPLKTRYHIEEVLAKKNDISAFSFIRENYFLGKKMRFGGWSEQTIKLFHKEKALYNGRVHELLQVDGRIEKLNAVIEHYPFDTFSDCLEKLNRYTTLDAKAMVEKNRMIPFKECQYQMTWKPLKVFWKIYVKKQAFREGVPGLVFASFWALGHFMKWTKYWEEIQNAPGTRW